MKKQPVAYNYSAWRVEQIIGMSGGILLLGAGGYILTRPGNSILETGPAIFAIVFFGTGLFFMFRSLFKPGVKMQMLCSCFSYRLFRKYGKPWFVVIQGGLIAFALILVSFMAYIKYKSTDHLLPVLVFLAGAFIPVMLLSGIYRLKKIEYILSTGEPVYDLYDEAIKNRTDDETAE